MDQSHFMDAVFRSVDVTKESLDSIGTTDVVSHEVKIGQQIYIVRRVVALENGNFRLSLSPAPNA